MSSSSKLKWRGQTTLVIHDGNGRAARLLSCAILEGRCPRCNRRFWVESRLGQMCCPHCGSDEIDWSWGALQIAFIPEKGGQFFGP